MSRLLMTMLAPLLFLMAAIAAPAGHAQTAGEVSSPASFVDVCADKSKERGRLRFCDEYFVQGLGAGADPVLYLRDRITVLRSQHEAAAEAKYESFLTAIYLTAFLAIATMVLVAADRRIPGLARWSTVTVSAALLVLIAAVAVDWLGKYRAEHSAQVEFGLLRDEIEVEAAQRIARGEQVTTDDVRKWTARMHEIGRRFAGHFSEGSATPDFDRFEQDN
ncbi:phenylalanyl-tRNA synthetase subunit alpha [Stappia sp. F7233]|uniref:Phenylalanyl-tRNA synthetase subunit alpha n=1 Tax=Stappia albiluteola TaxID=2758565 RepID=A0A839AAB7_9HYPH|nr:phenylalanyl-tRNA synthetase subunit alpha [Stappia albiluteola]